MGVVERWCRCMCVSEGLVRCVCQCCVGTCLFVLGKKIYKASAVILHLVGIVELYLLVFCCYGGVECETYLFLM